jgi:L-threonylcarbamoyladenylate synthase
VRPYGSRSEVERAGRELFAALRALDETGVTALLASSIGSGGLALAIRDRLVRAAEGRVKVLS